MLKLPRWKITMSHMYLVDFFFLCNVVLLHCCSNDYTLPPQEARLRFEKKTIRAEKRCSYCRCNTNSYLLKSLCFNYKCNSVCNLWMLHVLVRLLSNIYQNTCNEWSCRVMQQWISPNLLCDVYYEQGFFPLPMF
jgi:hypothetical protein